MNYKIACQLLLLIFGIIAIITGGMSMLSGITDSTYPIADDSFSNSANQILDMNLRFLSAIWLGVGIACIFAIRKVGQDNFGIFIVAGLILAGGIGRLDNFARFGGAPNTPYLLITISEFVGPILIIWTARKAMRGLKK